MMLGRELQYVRKAKNIRLCIGIRVLHRSNDIDLSGQMNDDIDILLSEYGIAIWTLYINNVRGVWEFNMSYIAGRDIIDNDSYNFV